MLHRSLYTYIWRTSRPDQVKICVLIALVTPLAMVPLELQRRIVEHVVNSHEVWPLVVFGSVYLGVVLVQGVSKFFLNIAKGRVHEEVARDLRQRTLQHVRWTAQSKPESAPVDEGVIASILTAESEDIAGFASESLSMPLLQVGTILWVLGYLLWVQPEIAALAAVIYAPQLFLVPRIQRIVNRLARHRTSLVRKLSLDVITGKTLEEKEPHQRRTHASILIQQVFKLRMLIYRYKYFLTFLGNFLDSLGPIIVLVGGGYLVTRGEADVSTLVVFISGFQKLSDPWDQLVTFYRSVANAKMSYELIVDSLEGAPPGKTGDSRVRRSRARSLEPSR
jgi:ABC-type multidrug transport system fused ATPase/permease subunit